MIILEFIRRGVENQGLIFLPNDRGEVEGLIFGRPYLFSLRIRLTGLESDIIREIP
jgi:hypothetical protein